MRDNDTITRKVVWTEINFALGKNGGYIPSSSGSRSISVRRQAGGQAGRQAVTQKFCDSTTSIQQILKLS